jgi:oxygen-independent coproporphyrinogen-3 oxidase
VPLSLYLHIPFCRHRCAYCDFNTYAGLDSLIPGYVEALRAELNWMGEHIRRSGLAGMPVHSLYFGGGTPSLLRPAQVTAVIEAAAGEFPLSAGIEITLEANPGTIDQAYLEAVRQAGVNRLSLGVQSADGHELQMLERQHGFLDVIQAAAASRQAGFDDLSLDMIYGLPGQRLDTWQHSLSRVLELAPDHLSLYSLSLEGGTPMQHWVGRGLLPDPDPDLAADMYAWAADRLEADGFEQYELSNWARRGHESRHNLQYWRNRPYLGLGAGAHSSAAGWRTVNVAGPRAYIARMQSAAEGEFPFSPAVIERLPIGRQEAMNETMILGLRLVKQGVSRPSFRRRFGRDPEAIYRLQLEEMEKAGMIERLADRLRLTRQARLVANQVFLQFI